MLNQRHFAISGMDCAEEVEALKATVGRLAGVQDIQFNLLRGTIAVEAEETVTEAAILDAVTRAGLQATALPREHLTSAGVLSPPSALTRARTLSCVLAGLSLAAGALWQACISAHAPSPSPPLAPGPLSCYLLAIVSGGWHVVPKAAAAATLLRPDMNLLMTLAVLGALGLGDWLEAASVTFLFALSLLLEAWSVGRARHAIRALMDLAPPTARRVDPGNGSAHAVPVAEILPGDHIHVTPGERVPLDAVVVRGSTHANEAPLTGESRPVSKRPGDELFAGTINLEGAITARVLRPATDTTLARIISMVEEAQDRKAPVEQWVDRFARRYTPAVIAIALAVAIVPPLLLQAAWGHWFYQALVILVIACPCALVISTPVAIVAGLTAAARQGVLIKGGVHLEMAARIKAVAFDKTGTLTRGQPEVQTIRAYEGLSPARVLCLAAALEGHSRHPLATAIRHAATRQGCDPPPACHFTALEGLGAEAEVEGVAHWIGNVRLMRERQAASPGLEEDANRLEDAGHSVVVLGRDREVIGMLGVADQLRENAAAALDALRAQGLQRIIMLTGDNAGTASAIARAIRLDECHAELMPADKMHVVHRLTETHGRVAMVGDGVNDAPALAAASLGVAMGAKGSDAAIETADVALMTDDLTHLPWLFAHSRRVLNTLRANTIIALTLKGIVMALSLAGLANLWMAIVADTGASLIVVAWSLRLLQSGSMPTTGHCRCAGQSITCRAC